MTMHLQLAAGKLSFLAMGLLAFGAGSGHAQESKPANLASAKVTSLKDLKAKGQELAAKAAESGAASETLTTSPSHYTMLAYRNRSGGAEVHAHYGDTFVILEGSAILQTGGTVVGSKDAGDGETRGTALENSTEQSLHTGDVVQIPAGVPHLMKLASGDTLLYYVIKTRDNPAQ